MNIEFSSCTVSGDTVELVAKVSMSLSYIAARAQKGDWEPDSISQELINKITTMAAEEYLAAHKMDLVNSVDLEQITKAVQLKVVERFSLNQG